MESPTEQLVLKKTHDFSSSKEPKLAAIFIHGIASDSSTFNQALKYLESRKSLNDVRFITFDLLGSGKSYKSDDLNYDYRDQLSALHNSITNLKLDIPLVLVGHSLGTLIVAKYASEHKNDVKKLILISLPVYTKQDFENPAFETAIKLFKDAVGLRNHKILEEKAFINSMEKIALNHHNYQMLQNLETSAIIIYGNKDQIIAPHNLPTLLKANRNIKAVKTEGKHGVTRDKFSELSKNLEEVLNAKNI